MQLNNAPASYDAKDQSQVRSALEREDKKNVKTGGPYLVQDTNGKWWKLVVDTSGVLSTVAA